LKHVGGARRLGAALLATETPVGAGQILADIDDHARMQWRGESPLVNGAACRRIGQATVCRKEDALARHQIPSGQAVRKIVIGAICEVCSKRKTQALDVESHAFLNGNDAAFGTKGVQRRLDIRCPIRRRVPIGNPGNLDNP
jgi:hypothetical protein